MVKRFPHCHSDDAQTSSVVYQRFPRILRFSGDRHGMDTPYDVWRYHVDSLLESKSYPKDVEAQAVRDSREMLPRKL